MSTDCIDNMLQFRNMVANRWGVSRHRNPMKPEGGKGANGIKLIC